MNIYPAILTESFETLSEQLALAQSNPGVNIVEIDVIDGYFADANTISPIDLAVADIHTVRLNLHLMTQEPQDFVFEATGLKSQLPINGIVGQIEQMSYQVDFLREVKVQGWRAGLALNIFTPVEAIDEASWDTVDMIELLAIEAGSQGQTFNPLVLEKMVEVQSITQELDHPVELIIDGGVTLDIATKLKQLGVDSVSVGSGIWAASDPEQALAEYLTAV
jgi:ribulose-phosphate 3-epimerase